MIWSLCSLGYAHELDLLELRLREQDPVVDRFVVSEAAYHYSGAAKPFHLDLRDDRWAPWREKLVVVQVEDHPDSRAVPHQHFGRAEDWRRENHQRRALGRALDELAPGDVVCISDLDEILRSTTLLDYQQRGVMGLTLPEIPMHRHFLNLHWRDRMSLSVARLCRGSLLIEHQSDPEAVRWLQPQIVWNVPYWNAYSDPSYDLAQHGWHFSWMGGPKAAQEKLFLAAHPEEIGPANWTHESIELTIASGGDLQGENRSLFWLPDSRLPAAATAFPHLLCGPEYATPVGVDAGAPHYYWNG